MMRAAVLQKNNVPPHGFVVCPRGKPDIGFLWRSPQRNLEKPMLTDSTDQSPGWGCAKKALEEIRACPGDLRALFLGAFDQLDELADKLIAQELARQHTERQTERDVLGGQIERLASLASELAESVAAQKKLVGQKPEGRRPESKGVAL
jgi:hypothetical protein